MLNTTKSESGFIGLKDEHNLGIKKILKSFNPDNHDSDNNNKEKND